MAREFPTGDVLSVATGRFFSPQPGLAGIHELLDYLTGDQLMIHQLPRAEAEARPWVLKQLPQLAGLEPLSDDAEVPEVEAWVKRQLALLGETLPVEPMPEADHTRIDPLQELAMNHPHVRVLPIVVEGQ